jgi:hypothetical protein
VAPNVLSPKREITRPARPGIARVSPPPSGLGGRPIRGNTLATSTPSDASIASGTTAQEGAKEAGTAAAKAGSGANTTAAKEAAKEAAEKVSSQVSTAVTNASHTHTSTSRKR